MDLMKGIVKDKGCQLYAVVDLAVLLLLALPLVLVKTHILEPADRLFYCDDVMLSFPAKKERFPTWIVIVLSLAIPMLTIFIVEMEAVKSVLLKAAADAKDIEEVVEMSHDKVYDILHGRMTRAALSFKFGFLMTDASHWITALTVGEFQPNFLSYCRPNVTDQACAIGLVSVGACSRDGIDVNDHRLSYWSENAAIAVYSMVFFNMYLQVRWPWGDPLLVRPLVQLLALILAQVVSLSQVADNQHVFDEILAGWVFGGTIALLTIIFVSGLLDVKVSPDKLAKVTKLRRGEVHATGSDWDSDY
ncbi:phospholipid phosphatase 3-like [Branchiostoma floridae x Branchiostoma japonicum]